MLKARSYRIKKHNLQVGIWLIYKMPNSWFVNSLWKGLHKDAHKSVGEDTFNVLLWSLLRQKKKKNCVKTVVLKL